MSNSIISKFILKKWVVLIAAEIVELLLGVGKGCIFGQKLIFLHLLFQEYLFYCVFDLDVLLDYVLDLSSQLEDLLLKVLLFLGEEGLQVLGLFQVLFQGFVLLLECGHSLHQFIVVLHEPVRLSSQWLDLLCWAALVESGGLLLVEGTSLLMKIFKTDVVLMSFCFVF